MRRVSSAPSGHVPVMLPLICGPVGSRWNGASTRVTRSPSTVNIALRRASWITTGPCVSATVTSQPSAKSENGEGGATGRTGARLVSLAVRAGGAALGGGAGAWLLAAGAQAASARIGSARARGLRRQAVVSAARSIGASWISLG